MATYDGGIHDIQTLLKDEINCCICVETFKNPKILPCHHTFCLKCLEDLGSAEYKRIGDSMPCPICRKQFTIPTGGFRALQNDFRMEKLLEAASKVEYLFCTQHEKIPLTIYCWECSLVLCTMCYFENHSYHKALDLGQAAGIFKNQIQEDRNTLERCISDAAEKLNTLIMEENYISQKVMEFRRSAEDAKKEVIKRALNDEISVLEAIECLKKPKIREIDERKADILQDGLALENCHERCADILMKGPAAAVCRNVAGIRKDASELVTRHEFQMQQSVEPFEVYFQRTNLADHLMVDNIIGTVEDSSQATLERKPRAPLEFLQEMDRIKRELREEKLLNEDLASHIESREKEYKKEKEAMADENLKLCKTIDYLHQEIQEKDKSFLVLEQNLEAVKRELGLELELEKLNYLSKVNKMKEELAREKTNFEKFKEMSKQTLLNVAKEREIYEGNINSLTCELNSLKESLQSRGKKSNGILNLKKTLRTKAASRDYRQITGIALLNETLFLCSQMSSAVEMYDIPQFTFLRRFNIENLIDSYHMISCQTSECLYILDAKTGSSDSSRIIKVDQTKKVIGKWSEKVDLGHLSITSEGNVLLTVFESSTLIEFSHDGCIISEIDLSQAGILHPLASMKLGSETLLISSDQTSDSNHSLFKISNKREIIDSFENLLPPVVVVFAGNHFYVLESGRSRVLVLSDSLEYCYELRIRKEELRCPTVMQVDVARGLFFISDMSVEGKGKLIILQHSEIQNVK